VQPHWLGLKCTYGREMLFAVFAGERVKGGRTLLDPQARRLQ
jgi:hypothetical protein